MNHMSVKTITLSFLYFVLSSLSFGDESQFYENTSLEFLLYTFEAYSLESDESSRLRTAKRISRTMFTYWYESRYLGLEKNDKWERLIDVPYLEYKRGVMKGDFLKDVFKDPLDWISGKNRKVNLEKHWKIRDKDEYNNLLAEYLKFLEERVPQGTPE